MAVRTLLFLAVVSITAAKRIRNVHKSLFQTKPDKAASSFNKMTGIQGTSRCGKDARSKLAKVAVKKGIALALPYELVASGIAGGKGKLLADLADTIEGPDFQHYDDNDELTTIDTVKKAIQFVSGKKYAKCAKKAIIGGAKVAAGVAGGVVGGTVGSVVPGAGTAAGGLLGWVASCALIDPLAKIADAAYRGCRLAYKTWYGTQGVHRRQAATVLFDASGYGKKDKDATLALKYIFGSVVEVYARLTHIFNFPDGSKCKRTKGKIEAQCPKRKRTAWIHYIESRMKSV